MTEKRLTRTDHARMTPEESAAASHEARLRAKRAYRARNVEKCREAWRKWYARTGSAKKRAQRSEAKKGRA